MTKGIEIKFVLSSKLNIIVDNLIKLEIEKKLIIFQIHLICMYLINSIQKTD